MSENPDGEDGEPWPYADVAENVVGWEGLSCTWKIAHFFNPFPKMKALSDPVCGYAIW